MWSAASDIFIENPFLGSGFSYYSNRVLELIKEGKHPKWIASHERPHNEYLNTLVNGGLVGLLLLSSIIISMLYIFHSLTKNTVIRLSGYLLISQFLIFSISEVFLSTKVTIVYFCIASALIIFLGLNEKENKNAEFNNQ
jgi:O-antigen ligase